MQHHKLSKSKLVYLDLLELGKIVQICTHETPLLEIV